MANNYDRELAIWKLALDTATERTVRWRASGGMVQVHEVRATLDGLRSPAAFEDARALLDEAMKARDAQRKQARSFPKIRPIREAR